jgi:glyoxylase-like metal-dependent hydrolase (beta-lactamase superfamily II)
MTPPPRVRHTAENITTLAGTEDGLVAATHLWWSEEGPVEDPLASDGDALTASRQQLLALRPSLIIPGHGAPFRPDPARGRPAGERKTRRPNPARRRAAQAADSYA